MSESVTKALRSRDSVTLGKYLVRPGDHISGQVSDTEASKFSDKVRMIADWGAHTYIYLGADDRLRFPIGTGQIVVVREHIPARIQTRE